MSKEEEDKLKADNVSLTEQVYVAYKRIVELNKQIEYLTSKLETMETQLELFSKEKLK
jgi:uncharacterized protein YaaN involved in tellurite resistance